MAHARSITLRFALAAALLLGNTVLPWLHLSLDHTDHFAASRTTELQPVDHHSHTTADCPVCDLIRTTRPGLHNAPADAVHASPLIGIVHLSLSRELGYPSLRPESSRAPPASA